MQTRVQYHQQYGVSAEEKGWVPSPQYLLRRKRILSYLQSRESCRILEIGCGAGALLYDLSQLGHQCTAMEISESALELANYLNRDNPGVKIHSAPEASFKGSFDIVIACEVLEHIEDDIAAFREWASYLKPGGELIISVPAHPRKWDATDEWAGHYRRYTKKRFQMLADAASCCPIRTECYSFPFTNLVAPVRAFFLKREMQRQAIKDSADQGQKELNTKKSGTSRPLQTKLYPLQKSLLGMWAIKLNYFLQAQFIQRECGLCYIFIVKNPEDDVE